MIRCLQRFPEKVFSLPDGDASSNKNKTVAKVRCDATYDSAASQFISFFFLLSRETTVQFPNTSQAFSGQSSLGERKTKRKEKGILEIKETSHTSQYYLSFFFYLWFGTTNPWPAGRATLWTYWSESSTWAKYLLLYKFLLTSNSSIIHKLTVTLVSAVYPLIGLASDFYSL